MAQSQNIPRQWQPIQVIARFFLRTIILMVFASFASVGFGRGLAALLWMSILFGAAIGTIKREPMFGGALNHWDEMVAYAALLSLASVFNHVGPA